MCKHDDGHSEQRVLKFFKPGQEVKIDTMRSAWKDTPKFHQHLAEVGDEIEFDDRRRALFQRIAGGGVDVMKPLVKFFYDRDFPDHCATIMSSIIADWTDNNTDTKSGLKISELLKRIIDHRYEDVMEWAQAADVADGGLRRINLQGCDKPLPNPFAFLTGFEGERTVTDLLVGKAHGDLNGSNILVPTKSEVVASDYVLIDCDRYSKEAPLTRDPMNLLVVMTLDNFDTFTTTKARQDIAKVLVDPYAKDPAPVADHVRKISKRIHEAMSPGITKGGLADKWRRQCLLSLIGVGLLYVGRKLHTKNEEEARRWCFYLAALAADVYLDKFSERDRPATFAKGENIVDRGRTRLPCGRD
jgi:hypothetical protein